MRTAVRKQAAGGPEKVSKHWKLFTPRFPIIGKTRLKSFQCLENRDGAALIVALWVLIILALLIGSFAFDMQIEAGITAYYRNRMKSQYVARAGVEYGKLLLKMSYGDTAEEQSEEDRESMRIAAINLSRGVGVSGLTRDVGEGRFTLEIVPEKGRRNVNFLSQMAGGDDAYDDWEEILDQAGVPESKWPELIDCFNDWVDPGDEYRLHGAESDDSFYQDRGYEVKNAPLDTVDELMLIKGFTREIVYGGTDEDGNEMSGIAHLLTSWGDDGKVNVNTASREVLLTLPGMEDWMADDLIAGRAGLDGEVGTKDDGYETVDEALQKIGLAGTDLAGRFTTSDRKYVRMVSIGEVSEVKSGIWCVLDVSEDGVKPVFWREEAMR